MVDCGGWGRVRAWRGLAAFWWTTVPNTVGRLTCVGRALLRDGAPMSSVPVASASAPAAALAVGLMIGAVRP